MTRKYYIIAYKGIESSGKWKITSLTVEAADRTDAEWKIREKGYTPLSVQRFK